MNKLSRREKMLLIAAFLALSGFIFLKYYFIPLKTELTSLTTHNRQLEKDLQQIKVWEKKEYQLQTIRDKLVKEDKANTIRVPHRPGKAELLVSLDELARRHQLRLLVVEQREREPKKGDFFPGYVVKGKLNGSYHNLWSFFRELESGGRLLVIEQVTIHRSLQRWGVTQVPAIEPWLGTPDETGSERAMNMTNSLSLDGTPLICDFILAAYYDSP